MFKMMANADPKFAEDYPEDDGESNISELSDDIDDVGEIDNNSVDEIDKYGRGVVPDAIVNAWEYEDELDMAGYLPNEVHGEEAWEKLPRVNKKAAENDKRAKELLKGLDECN